MTPKKKSRRSMPGADDYVTKPFDTAELLARVRAAQRRSLTETGEPIFKSGALCVDFAARQVNSTARKSNSRRPNISLAPGACSERRKGGDPPATLANSLGRKGRKPGAISSGLRYASAKKLEANTGLADPDQDGSRHRLSIVGREPLAVAAFAGVNDLLALRSPHFN